MTTAMYTKNDMGVALTDTFVNEYAAIPEHMRTGLVEYVILHRPVGGFLQAVISNDLRNAALRADLANLPLLRVYVLWLTWNAPGNCWGSREAYEQWTLQDVHDKLASLAGTEFANFVENARAQALQDCAEHEQRFGGNA